MGLSVAGLSLHARIGQQVNASAIISGLLILRMDASWRPMSRHPQSGACQNSVAISALSEARTIFSKSMMPNGFCPPVP